MQKKIIIILVTFVELIKNRKYIKEVRNCGYRFAYYLIKKQLL
jgi:hypothetical protein